MDRRQYLSVVAAGVTTGCASPQTESVRIPYILAENFRTVEVSITARLETNGTVVLSRQTTLPPAEYSEGQIQRVPGTVWRVTDTFEPPVTLVYQINSSENKSVSATKRAEECVRPEIEAKTNGESLVTYVYDCSTPLVTETSS